ncbi:hypothetical protein PMNALOAF_3531 [Methylobacterium adhaesivum]|uniref:Recombinase family protein n=1 Tax=Methylobacterium adhaesivum TaxID=333297 RepID=A0ABT8BL23_9HYPH|nr:recombinase family protein [Methylobacterium adhaesivum]MDN3592390.1 recombinase family protein [Methylobacterium adhaesivum]GJD32263.1 hypothetical protein PMNALOAF_3531 [Methylobacterium adhaesivum]
MTNQHLLALHGDAVDLPSMWLPNPGNGPTRAIPPRGVGVVYARYSSDKQSETSVERQFEICAEHAARNGITLIKTYADRAKPGTTVVGRDELEEMLDAARRGLFSILIIENVDRLARDLSYLSAVFKELKALGIEMHQPGRGRLDLPDIAFHGFMGEEGRRLFLERSQYGRMQMVRNGRIPHKPAYGYGRTPGRPGEQHIIEAEAEIVRQIFQMFVEGLSMMKIARALNARTDNQRYWKDCSIRSMFKNPLYAGFIVYNQSTVVTDPITRKRVAVQRPRSEWVVVRADHLQIVERAAWEAVQARISGIRSREAPTRQAPGKYLLSRKVKCSGCGMTTVPTGPLRQRRFACIDRAHGGTCKNFETIKVAELERVVIDLVAENVLDPRCTEAYVAAYNEAKAGSHKDHEAARSDLKRQRDGAMRALDATFDDALMAGFNASYLAEKRRTLTSTLNALDARIDSLPAKPLPIGLDQGRMTMLREALDGLVGRLPFMPNNEADFRLVAAFGELIDHIVVRRLAYARYEAEVHLTVTPLLRGPTFGADDLKAQMCLRRTYELKTMKEKSRRWRRIVPSLLAQGRHVLQDAEWDAISHLFPEGLLLRKDRTTSWDARPFVEAYLFILMHGVPWPCLPESFGPFNPVYLGVGKFCTYGIWKEVATILHDLDPERFPAEFAEKKWKKMRRDEAVARLVEETRAARADTALAPIS